MHILLFVCLLLSILKVFAKEGEKPPCITGNFAVPSSQQPGPFISFGENIISQNQTQLYLFGDILKGQNKTFIEALPSILYGITNDFSFLVSVPFAVRFMEDHHHSSGLEDISAQLEYAFFARENLCSSDQATIVASAAFPTGSTHKNPPTGLGSMTYFIGATYNHMEVNWFYFTSYGAFLTTAHNGTREGNEFLYEFGVGRNIFGKSGWIFAWLTEINGIFSQRGKTKGKTDPNSGGNVIYLTPSLWASSKDWIFQLGLGYAVQQNLFGHQNREGYLFAFNIGRTF